MFRSLIDPLSSCIWCSDDIFTYNGLMSFTCWRCVMSWDALNLATTLFNTWSKKIKRRISNFVNNYTTHHRTGKLFLYWSVWSGLCFCESGIQTPEMWNLTSILKESIIELNLSIHILNRANVSNIDYKISTTKIQCWN